MGGFIWRFGLCSVFVVKVWGLRAFLRFRAFLVLGLFGGLAAATGFQVQSLKIQGSGFSGSGLCRFFRQSLYKFWPQALSTVEHGVQLRGSLGLGFSPLGC